MTVVVVRHAKAESGEEGADHDRRLTDRGRRTAADGGRWLAERVPAPDEVWCSSAVRAVQTWEAMAPALRAPAAQVSRDLYLADAASLTDRLRRASGDVVLVGHNPTLEQVVHALTGELRGLRPGAIALVDPSTADIVDLWDPPR